MKMIKVAGYIMGASIVAGIGGAVFGDMRRSKIADKEKEEAIKDVTANMNKELNRAVKEEINNGVRRKKIAYDKGVRFGVIQGNFIGKEVQKRCAEAGLEEEMTDEKIKIINEVVDERITDVKEFHKEAQCKVVVEEGCGGIEKFYEAVMTKARENKEKNN